MNKRLIVASTSTVHGSTYLEYILPTLKTFFKEAKEILFIPYARPGGISYEVYTAIAKKAFLTIDKNVKGVHEFENPIEAVKNANAIFTGGGNTFELVNQLYKNNLIEVLKKTLEKGTPYLGTSAGSNICGVTMMNTNDMPIVYPPSFDTLGMIPFNINAHYLDPNPDSTHMGETRETRIKEFHVFNKTSVLGLREGSWLEVIDNVITIRGKYTARLFQQGKDAIELESDIEIQSYFK
ncbi:(alpha)-aspartyl dipeptidase [Tenacibaculum holothuriorum]|uniref:(Alpha)-aspartyl dipeptidase n=1 Tax=Tenacibaculum holothuriorum TaxID=1635173 RepID=A0A1Y2PI59_9FLAO|nr:dipeptidase PepE [Tenacibaculum holothuriorum]OSY89419.1 (alpha)-aspartyl dipeptidase [Tenacibaculum holothuriorum]